MRNTCKTPHHQYLITTTSTNNIYRLYTRIHARVRRLLLPGASFASPSQPHHHHQRAASASSAGLPPQEQQQQEQPHHHHPRRRSVGGPAGGGGGGGKGWGHALRPSTLVGDAGVCGTCCFGFSGAGVCVFGSGLGWTF